MKEAIIVARRKPLAPAVALALVSIAGTVLAEEEKRRDMELPTVEVVGTTPLPVLGTPLEQVPANVQSATEDDIARDRPLSVGDFMERNLESVATSSAQGNPFQIDLTFRGFAATPLIGAPQGLSVFLDGVRVNEPFGDTVNWDLIPTNAISAMNLIPGSDPVFGLNTLGGALAIRTKSGREHPGGSITAYGGSFGRYSGEFEYGGSQGDLDYFVAGTYFDENGWRDHSPSTVKQLFGKFGYETSSTDIDLSLLYADTNLQGTQASPLSLLAASREAAYTYPDITDNRVYMGNLSASHYLDNNNLVAGNLYFRNVESKNFSSNSEDDFDPTQAVGVCLDPPACTEFNFRATNDRSKVDTDGYGGALQYSYLGNLFGRANQFTLGASYDYGRTDFIQEFQFADFTADRGTFGLTGFSLLTDVETSNRYYGLYFSDVLSLTPQLHMTLAGRYNRAKAEIRDQTGLEPALNGSHTFSRFNPAVGFNWNLNPAVNTYIGYNEGMRAPTAVELTCADPNAPCKLPNAFLADPPLEPVIAKTWEGGMRGRVLGNTNYSFALFHTDLEDDIQFIGSATSPGAGFFQNVGETRRQGLEFALSQRYERLRMWAAYSLIEATFESPLLINSPFNSSADANGQIQVNPGNRIPGIPRHQLKFRADYAFTPKFSAGITVQAFSDQYARGDENNQDINGKVPGYSIVNLDASYQWDDRLQFWAKANNVFNVDYESFGVLGENFFTGTGFTYYDTTPGAAPRAEQFRGPGAPFGIWVGVTYWFDKPKGGAKGGSPDRD
ncbi:MAG TPA: TonB-dependent receptor [Burkholderiales bacterium]